MPKFRSQGPSMIYRGGHRIHFDENKEYSTNDPREIAILRRSRRVIEAKEGRSAPARSKEQARKISASDYTREQLDQIAEASGVSDPDDYSSKKQVADAINESRGFETK